MAGFGGRDTSAKVYCSTCDRVFDSRKQYEQHAGRCRFSNITHKDDQTQCESCPIDTAISRLVRFLRRGMQTRRQ